MPRSEPKPKRKASEPREPRFEIDSTWLRRGALALAVIAFIVVLAKASMMMFSGGGKRLERHERAMDEQAARQAAKPDAR